MVRLQQRQTGYVHARDLAPVDVIGDHRVARPIVGIFADPAGAENVAVASLEQRTFQHVGLPRGPRPASPSASPHASVRLSCSTTSPEVHAPSVNTDSCTALAATSLIAGAR